MIITLIISEPNGIIQSTNFSEPLYIITTNKRSGQQSCFKIITRYCSESLPIIVAKAFIESLMIILTMSKSESQVCITANKRNEPFTQIIAKNGSDPCFEIIARAFSEPQSIDNSIWTQRVIGWYNNNQA